MNKSRSQKGRLSFSFVISFLLIFAATAVFSGCEPLRKKFIRQKKNQTEETGVVPVLQPEEYPAPVQTKQDQYRYHYSLWNVWQKELLTVLDSDGSDKRLLSITEEMMKQLGLMQQLAGDKKGEIFGRCKASLLQVKKQFDQPVSLRNNFVIKSQVLRLGRDVRQNLRFDQMQESLNP